MAETSTNANLHLTSGHLLARNTIWNLIGNGAPMIVALFSIPILIHRLGGDRFGVLALAWALIGYASLFDIGLGRALTQLVAKKLGAGEENEVPQLVWTSLLLLLLLGALGTVFVAAISPWLVHHALKIPENLQPESLRAFYLLGLSVPVAIATAALRGVLEAHQRFMLVNALRIPLGVLTFAGPLIVLLFSRSLVPIVGVLVASRAAVCLAHFWVCLRVVPDLRWRVAWHRPSAVPLLRFGGWMTISNIVTPLMITLDRFIIGGLLSVGAVAYYATPFEVVTKLLLIPAALTGVMFPAFSSSFAQDPVRTAELCTRCVKYLFLVLFPFVFLTVCFAQGGLELWLGAEFASHSYRVLQWLALGVFVNGLAQVPFALVQGVGKPDITGKLHLIEFPVYVLILWFIVHSHGIEGAAIAWTGRAVLDCVLLFAVSRKLLAEKVHLPRWLILMFLGGVTSSLASFLLTSTAAKGVLASIVLATFGFVAWILVLTPAERALVRMPRKLLSVGTQSTPAWGTGSQLRSECLPIPKRLPDVE